MRVYFIRGLQLNIILCIAQLVPALVTENSLVGFYAPSGSPHPFWVLSYLLASQDPPGSSSVFLAQTWNQLLLQGALVPFVGGRYLETTIWVVGVLVASGVPIIMGPHFSLFPFAIVPGVLRLLEKCMIEKKSSCYNSATLETVGSGRLFSAQLKCKHFWIVRWHDDVTRDESRLLWRRPRNSRWLKTAMTPLTGRDVEEKVGVPLRLLQLTHTHLQGQIYSAFLHCLNSEWDAFTLFWECIQYFEYLGSESCWELAKIPWE